jgi:ubiquinol-cytochrome c reductase iron-sulfur subunit
VLILLGFLANSRGYPKMANTATADTKGGHDTDDDRRDFLMLAGGALGVAAAGAAAWPLIDSMNPAADTLAASTTEVDLSPIKEGQAITVKWRGSPVFIRHRSKADAEKAQAVPLSELPDPQTDVQRFGAWPREQWLVVVGVCTHLGCIPLGQNSTDKKGDFGGWYCPCHGSHYDTSGRIRKGPAPANLPVPAYTITKENKMIIGQAAEKKTGAKDKKA